MQAEFWKFNKRANSTKRPDGQGATISFSVRQNFTNKEGDRTMNVCAPTIFITDATNNIDKLYNYMRMNGRYYFIREASRGYDNTVILRCEIDSLATLKDDIANTEAFVAYSASDYNRNIDDTRNHDTVAVTNEVNSNGIPFPIGVTSYLLTVKGGDGLATTYLLTASQLQQIAEQINQTFGEVTRSSWDAATAIWNRTDPSQTAEQNNAIILEGWGAFFGSITNYLADNYFEYLADIKDSIVDLKYTFVDHDFLASGGLKLVKLGTFATTILGYDATNSYLRGNVVSATVPILGSGYTRGDRFSSYGIYLPYSGTYPITADDILGSGTDDVEYNELRIIAYIAPATLDIAYGIYNAVDKPLFIAGGNCGASTFLSTNNVQQAQIGGVQAAIKTGVSLATGIVTGGVSTAISLISAVNSAIGTIHPQQLSSGGAISSLVGGLVGRNDIITYCSMRGNSGLIGQSAYNLVGGPLFAVRRLGDLSGYCKCIEASIESNDLYEILYIANRQINNGFFIE